MEDEIMNTEDEVMDTEIATTEVEPEETGMGTGVAMLIGAGLTLAVGAAVKVGKKLYAKYKAKKELRKPNDDDVVEVTDEGIENVTK